MARAATARAASRERKHARPVEIAILGAGFAGVGMAARLLEAGIEDFVVLEKAGDVGGTWRENTYPGCRCDVPSHLYSYSFAPNPDWSSTYSRQPEILDYIRGVAARHGIYPHVRFGHEVTGAEWLQAERRWRIQTTEGELTARVLIAAPGPLHEPSIPELAGVERFRGVAFHSARWRHDYDLAGKSVAVVGTGASAIQFVPRIQPQVGRLHLFQRTAPWVMPRPGRTISAAERRLHRRLPIVQASKRAGVYWSRELFLLGFIAHPQILAAAERVATRTLERQISDPDLRRRLTPDFRLGCKRVLIADDYYPALAQPNVEVVTAGIQEVRAHSVIDRDGIERPVDAIIYGTGFHVTDLPLGALVRGRDGCTLDDLWRGTPRAYLGATVPGFPNLFLLAGPNTGIGHTSLVFLIECQIAYVLDCLCTMASERIDAVDVRPDVWRRYNDAIQERSRSTVWLTGGCDSWYLDRNGVNSTLYPDFTFRFRRMTRRFRVRDYETARARPEAGSIR